MPLLTLVRHAPTPWNENRRIQGRTDISISEPGKSSVEAWIIPQPIWAAYWFSSPLRRALETASVLGVNVKTEDRLIEMSWGAWEGEKLQELREIHGEAMLRNESLGLDFCAPEGESPRMVQERVKPWLASIGKLEYPVAAVTHRGVIRAVTALATGWDMTGKELHKMTSGTGRQFDISKTGQPVLLEPDVSFLV